MDISEVLDRLERLELRVHRSELKLAEILPSVDIPPEIRKQMQEKYEVLAELVKANNAYRAAMLLGVRHERTDFFTIPLQFQLNNIAFANNWFFRIEAEIARVRRELRVIRILHRSLWPFAAIVASFRRFTRLFTPKLGKLFHHDAIAMEAWGLPPASVKAVSVAGLPVISLVTPSFSQGSFIGRTLDSVLDQAYPKLEYFIQDGGSNDDTVEVLKSYSTKLAGWVSEKDSGQSQAINLGFARTTGEIMAWLNSDDLLLPGTLAYVANYFQSHPEVDVVYGHRILIDEQDREIGRWILPAHDNDVLSSADYVPQETLFWRRSIWEKTGGAIDESFRFAMDWDLLLRFRDAGARFERLPYFMGAFRIHEAQKTSAAINSIGMAEMDRLRTRCHGRSVDYLDISKEIGPYLIRHMIEDFAMRFKRRLSFL